VCYVRSLGFNKVELNVDLEAVVQGIKRGRMNSALSCSLMKQIVKLLSLLDWVVEISHTYREANKCADTIANKACTLDYEITTYETRPSYLSNLFNFIGMV
jgi:hypothetical protein